MGFIFATSRLSPF